MSSKKCLKYLQRVDFPHLVENIVLWFVHVHVTSWRCLAGEYTSDVCLVTKNFQKFDEQNEIGIALISPHEKQQHFTVRKMRKSTRHFSYLLILLTTDRYFITSLLELV